jgi:hypothetical protein|tara:strand:+ start:16314 stop:16463 length:150 start_codon:yes stop_codon:yes gene_type:complete
MPVVIADQAAADVGLVAGAEKAADVVPAENAGVDAHDVKKKIQVLSSAL